jgi:hypothetical protein
MTGNRPTRTRARAHAHGGRECQPGRVRPGLCWPLATWLVAGVSTAGVGQPAAARPGQPATRGATLARVGALAVPWSRGDDQVNANETPAE